jgi:1-acyl-sn-glycerol-3-phosphate acyltransferase
MIRTFLLALYFAVAIVLALPWLILWTVIVGNAELMYWLSMRVVRLGNRIAGIRVRIENLENIPPGACLFIANHVSNVDPLAFIPAIPRRVAILVKQELFRIPILSTGMRRAQFVPVDRSDREAAAAIVDVAARVLKNGVSFAIFPEGTRSADGRLRPFKRGAFTVAIAAGVPIVPVSISGTQLRMRKGEWFIRSGEVLVRFGPPVESSAYKIEQRFELLARVEALVAAGLPPEQQPLPRTSRAG